MFKDKKVLAVVPARGGSKGVPHKNIHPLLGKPLISWTGELLQKLTWIDKSVVSTDSERIAVEAKKSKLEAPFYRPEDLSGDRIGDIDVLIHALEASEKHYNEKFDIVLMLQPTCPLRKALHVEKTVEALCAGNFDASWTLSETNLKYHPLKQLTLKNGSLKLFDSKGHDIIARQQLEPVYHRNGACYAFTRECLLETRTIYGKNTTGVVIDDPLLSIDTLEDFAEIEDVLKNNL